MAATYNLIKEHLEVEDLNLLKARKPIHHDRQMVIWRFQMQATSQQIKNFYKESDNVVSMLSRGVRKALDFMDKTLISYDITDEEWNFAGPESIHG